VVRPGAASHFVLGRFEAERQALAAMSHPHVAAVYDGGTTPDGRPYFVMELVDGGRPITQFSAGLPFADRLALFHAVCEAVQHAHQRGVLHRDLKPSNVLVAAGDGRPVVKVIDFGVAKALDVPAGQGGRTSPGTLVGTPEYMSPEQADLSARDVDVRSDVYALAVLLYELVTGDTPVPRERVRQAPLLDVLQAVRGEDAPPVGAKRRGLPPELEWILAKGLSKDRERRYASVAAFADDLRRMTRHEAVTAAPVGGWYRAAKFVRRNWVAVSAAAAVLLALLAGTAGTTVGMLRAQDAERTAEARRVEAETAKERESEQLHQAEIVVDILESAFANLESSAAAGDLRQKLLRQLGEVERKIETDHAANPVARMRLWNVCGQVYVGMDEPKKAIPLFEKLVSEAAAHYGEDDRRTCQAKTSYAVALSSGGRHATSAGVFAELVPRMERVFGPTGEDTLRCRVHQALAVSRVKGWADALPLFESAHADARKHLGEDHTVTKWARIGLAGAYLHCKRSADGLALLDDQLKAVDGEERPSRWAVEVYEMAVASYNATRQYEKNLPVLKKLIAHYQADAPEHISHRRYVGQLQQAYKAVGDLSAEESTLQALLELCRKYDGERSFNVADTLHNLGDNRVRQKKYTEAVTVLGEALEMRQGLKPNGYTQYATRRLLGRAHAESRQYDKAEEHLLKAHDGLTKLRPATGKALDPMLADTRRLLRELYTAWDKPDEAAKWKESPPKPAK
jgi:eukaryotic-like serine/threonine-protein kinase